MPANDHSAPNHHVIDDLTPEEIRNLVFDTNNQVYEKFKALCNDEIERAIEAIAQAHETFRDKQPKVVLDERTGTVQLFVHVAINSILSSLHHLVSGYPIAAGHLMRHFTEALAMALMCADEATGIYQVYDQHRSTYAVQSAPGRLRKKKIRRALEKSMKFDSAGWEGVLKLAKLYDELSHVSSLALAHQIIFSEEGGTVLGAEFDPEKKKHYRDDVIRRRSAAESLAHIIPIIMDTLPQKPKDDVG